MPGVTIVSDDRAGTVPENVEFFVPFELSVKGLPDVSWNPPPLNQSRHAANC